MLENVITINEIKCSFLLNFFCLLNTVQVRRPKVVSGQFVAFGESDANAFKIG